MTVTDVRKDTENLTMTITAQFTAPRERVWQLWENPRKLERWWGPPTFPATFQAHDLTAGGRAAYFMTGPEGEQYHGWWQIRQVEAPELIVFEDGFADEAGEPNPTMPVTLTRVDLRDAGAVTTMTIETTFPTADAMAQLLAMQMEEGMTQALGQMDALLEEDAAVR